MVSNTLEANNGGAKIAMVGGNLKDAPFLVTADVGISLGKGGDVVVVNAMIKLLSGNLLGVVRARKLATATVHKITQVLFFAFACHTEGASVAASTPYFVSVIANTLRSHRVHL